MSLDLPELPRRLSVQTLEEKRQAFGLLTEHIHRNILTNRHLPELLLPKARVSDESLIVEQFASWDELRELASDRLITVGGHTVTHALLRDLEEDQAIAEISIGKRRLEAQLMLLSLISRTHTGQARIVVSENSLWPREPDS